MTQAAAHRKHDNQGGLMSLMTLENFYFLSRPGNPPLLREAFFNYFPAEAPYHHGEDAVSYSNEDTGVYFHWCWHEAEAEGNTACISFELDYFRPHTFGLEAAEVLRPFVDHFDLIVEDPQPEGLGKGEFSEEGFLCGYEAQNRATSRSIAAHGEREGGDYLRRCGVHWQPRTRNRAYWEWNRHRQRLDHALSDEGIELYVPQVYFCVIDGEVRSFTLCNNLDPMAVPKVDHVLVARHDLQGRYKKQSKPGHAWVSWSELVEAAPDFQVREASGDVSLPYLILFSEEYDGMASAPRSLVRWAIGLPDWGGPLRRIEPRLVLDTELLMP
jgi:hypothetical protein